MPFNKENPARILAAVHVDHEETARAIPLLGCHLNVPRAYPTIGKPAVGIEYRSPFLILKRVKVAVSGATIP
jgi:hypothetical protein